MKHISLYIKDGKFLFILTEVNSKNPSEDKIKQEFAVLKGTLGIKSLNEMTSHSVSYMKIDNSKRVIKESTYKYIDKETGEEKTGVENNPVSYGQKIETQFIFNTDDVLSIELDAAYLQVIGCSIDANTTAYIHVKELIYSLQKSNEQALYEFVYQTSQLSFIQ